MKTKQQKIDEINQFCELALIENYEIREDLSIDVDGDVDLSGHGLTELPIKFHNIEGYFNCEYNQLTTLKNAPKYVAASVIYSNNLLTSFEGFPKLCFEVIAYDNPFKTIDYLPAEEDDYLIEVDRKVEGLIKKFKRDKNINSILS